MASNKNYITLLCFYAENDAFYKETFSKQMELLQGAGTFDYIRYTTAEQHFRLELRETEIIRDFDVVLFLLSHHFLTTEYARSSRIKNLFRANGLQQIVLVHLMLEPLVNKQFLRQGGWVLPKSEETFKFDLQGNPTPHFLRIIEELQIVLNRFRLQKLAIEKAWVTAKQANTSDAFFDFLEEFPLGKHAKQAQVTYHNLLEKELWREVLLRQNIENILTYLRDAPLQNHRAEAYELIAGIESLEEVAWKDVTENSTQIAILLDFKSRFPKSAKRGAVEENIREVLSNYLIKEGIERADVHSEAHHLTYLCYDSNLSATELLSLELLINYTNSLTRKVGGLINKLDGLINNLRLGISSVLLFLILYLLAQLYYSVPPTASAYLLRLGLPVVVIAGAVYLLYFVIGQVKSDLDFCVQKQQFLLRENIALRVSFLHHDKKSIQATLLEMQDIEDRIVQLQRKGIFDYLYQ